ncbi:MAG: FAD-dependent oxidoreductase [Betaproteobacteria bacterium]|nr:FAD-dependent oxidoreductase [Betaproteobacteria bacterium]
MKRVPISPAQIVFDEDGTPGSATYGDVYHARAGAIEQARAVFLEGNGLPQRWRGRDRFVILETGFGLGQNFLATWQAWAQDPQAIGQLWFVSIEKHPIARAQAQRALSVHEGTPLQGLARELLNQWPAASPDAFRASFHEGRIVLQVVHADAAVALREWQLQADAVYLDGFSPRRNPEMWSPPLFKALAQRVAPGCTAATWSTSSAVREGLIQAGFEVERLPGFADKRARLAARLTRPRRAAAQHASGSRSAHEPRGTTSMATPVLIRPGLASAWTRGDPPVVIVGAGLAGAACAQALAAAGVPSLVLDRASEPAQGASGNPAGLFHGVLHPEDGAHARLGRAAAWMAHRHYAPLIDAGVLIGQAHGLIRREDALDAEAMQALIDRLGLPSEYVQPLAASQLSALLRTPVQADAPAWFYPGGGWIDPAAWVRHALSRPGVQFQGQAFVQEVRRSAQEWTVLGPNGQPLARTQHLVLCAAVDVLALLPAPVVAEWPVGVQRGQITQVPHHELPAAGPACPISGGGYALTLLGGDVLCGATASRHDPHAGLRAQDHVENLQRLNRLLGWHIAPEPATLHGRVGWRFHASDRLPIVGPVQALDQGSQTPHATRLRELPVETGLYAATALGSRGITWAPMVGAVMAHWITGEPAPLPNPLMQAIDPRRFALQRSRRSAAAAIRT